LKKYLLLLIPGLLILNACNEGHQGLGADQTSIIEESLLAGQEDSRNDGSPTAKAPQIDGTDLPEAPPAVPAPDDGSHSLNPDAVPGHGPVTYTPAFPSGGSGGNGDNGGNSGNHHQPVQDWDFQAQASNGSEGIRQLDDNTNLNANAEDQGQGGQGTGVQAIGDHPKLSVSSTLVQVYDPFCNCYKTGPNDSSIDLMKNHPPLQNSGNSSQTVQATGSDEDDDD
jgi:hypothetical protein